MGSPWSIGSSRSAPKTPKNTAPKRTLKFRPRRSRISERARMPVTLSRRLFGQAAFLGSLGLSMTGFRAAAAELATFEVGEAAPANTYLAIWMAQDAGLYQAQGLKLEIVPTVGGSQSGPDLASGRIHLM